MGGRQHQKSTKEESLVHAKDIAEDWFIELRGKSRAGILKNEEAFAHAAKVFMTNYEILIVPPQNAFALPLSVDRVAMSALREVKAVKGLPA